MSPIAASPLAYYYRFIVAQQGAGRHSSVAPTWGGGFVVSQLHSQLRAANCTTMDAADAHPATRPGEESKQLGEDAAFVFRYRKALDAEPLAASVLAALKTMAAEFGLDLDELKFIIEMREHTLRATLEREGITGFWFEFAVAIYLYTIDSPKLYEMINSASHAPDRAADNGELSPKLRACMPFIKFLDSALDALPTKFLYTGRVNRGVKWAFPTPNEHDPEAHFPREKRFFWYEFKSAAQQFDVMYHPMFCGANGPRTIFVIDACESYTIAPFSQFPTEAEALFRPLAQFEVTFAQKKLLPKHLRPGATGGFPDEVHLKQLPSARKTVKPLGPVPSSVAPRPMASAAAPHHSEPAIGADGVAEGQLNLASSETAFVELQMPEGKSQTSMKEVVDAWREELHSLSAKVLRAKAVEEGCCSEYTRKAWLGCCSMLLQYG